MAGDYQNLDVWKKSMDLAVQVYSLVKTLPNEEMYGLSSQMRRAAVSISSNTAEGRAGRQGVYPLLKSGKWLAFGARNSSFDMRVPKILDRFGCRIPLGCFGGNQQNDCRSYKIFGGYS